MSMSSSDTAEAQPDEDFESYVRSQLAQYDVRIEELEEKLKARDDRIAELEKKVAELDDRTDMLRLVEDSDQLSGKERSAALLQHLQREARNSSGEDRTAVTRERAEEVLHYPDIDRTTYYTDFKRCVRLVGDEDICWYESSSNGARLVLDLDGVENVTQLTTEFATE